MMNRLCFVICVLWFAFCCIVTDWQHINTEGAHAVLGMGIAPFIVWLGGRLLFRYIRFGFGPPKLPRRY